jgi:hypothetical protein
MNLHSIVRNYIGAVNPQLIASIQFSTGYTTNADGTQVPAYAPAVTRKVQAQALQFRDLMQVNGLNLNGTKLAMYIDGDIEGVDRPTKRGGDLITLPDGTIWLVVLVLENWSKSAGWTKVAVVKQNGS